MFTPVTFIFKKNTEKDSNMYYYVGIHQQLQKTIACCPYQFSAQLVQIREKAEKVP
jgi:hypothetical protein